jgi:hypothetical protein
MAVIYSTQAAFAAIDGACSFTELAAIRCRKCLPAQAFFVHSTEGLLCSVSHYMVYTEIDIKIIILVIWGWEHSLAASLALSMVFFNAAGCSLVGFSFKHIVNFTEGILAYAFQI